MLSIYTLLLVRQTVLVHKRGHWKPVDSRKILFSLCKLQDTKNAQMLLILSLSPHPPFPSTSAMHIVHNRIGKLCGACSSNFSLAIGSSRCMKCPDNYSTLLLIAFIVAGVVVVMFIKVLDVTVATGTINGLILYTNIIWTNSK